MLMLRYITAVQYVSDYKLILSFDDSSAKLVDLEPHLDGPIFEPLKDITYFQTVRVDPDLDTIVWGNGADMAPEFLFEIGVLVVERQIAR